MQSSIRHPGSERGSAGTSLKPAHQCLFDREMPERGTALVPRESGDWLIELDENGPEGRRWLSDMGTGVNAAYERRLCRVLATPGLEQ